MNSSESRRAFLSRLAALLAGGSGLSMGQFMTAATSSKAKTLGRGPVASIASNYKISAWTGDNFLQGHKFRDGNLPGQFPDKPESSIDFVIIGGGIAGLTTAFYLKDHSVMLLDQYDSLGGQSRGGRYHNIDYSYGPVSVDRVDGIYGQLYSDLGIKPATLKNNDNNFLWHNKWTNTTAGQSAGSLQVELAKLNEQIKSAVDSQSITQPITAVDSPCLAKLDSMPFASLLKDYSPEFVMLINKFCKSKTCGNTTQISTLSGAIVLDSLQGQRYAFAGGNPAIANALEKKLAVANATSLQKKAFAWKVELHDGHANVFYSSADGVLHNIECRHVIIATPPMVTWRLINNLDDRQKGNLMPFKYGSYFVANCLLKKELFPGSFDNWLSQSFAFSDLIVAETPYKIAGNYKANSGSVLTMRHPFEPGSTGRPLLLAGDRNAFAYLAHDQLAHLVEHLDQNLEEVILTRWGHAIAVPTPGYFARLQKIASSYAGPYSLAHSSTQGIQNAESAIRAARVAADRAIATSARTSIVSPDMPKE